MPNAGVYDVNIDNLGFWLNSLKRPISLRLGYEFDNPYFRNWLNNKYAQAYRYIVESSPMEHDMDNPFLNLYWLNQGQFEDQYASYSEYAWDD